MSSRGSGLEIGGHLMLLIGLVKHMIKTMEVF